MRKINYFSTYMNPDILDNQKRTYRACERKSIDYDDWMIPTS